MTEQHANSDPVDRKVDTGSVMLRLQGRAAIRRSGVVIPPWLTETANRPEDVAAAGPAPVAHPEAAGAAVLGADNEAAHIVRRILNGPPTNSGEAA